MSDTSVNAGCTSSETTALTQMWHVSASKEDGEEARPEHMMAKGVCKKKWSQHVFEFRGAVFIFKKTTLNLKAYTSAADTSFV